MKKEYFDYLPKGGLFAFMGLLFSAAAVAQTSHAIANTGIDVLQVFIEDTTQWAPGDTVLLSEEGIYVVDSSLAIYQSLVLMGDPSLDTRPVINFTGAGYFAVRSDELSVTIKGIDFDGYDATAIANSPNIVRFENAADSVYEDVLLEDIEAWGFQQGLRLNIQNATAVFNSVTINNVIWHDFVTNNYAIEPRQNYVKEFTITNSTFYNIAGGFITNFGFQNVDDDRPALVEQEILIDRNTFYNVVGVGSNRSFIQMNDAADGSITLTFSNNIVSTLKEDQTTRPFRINESAGLFSFENSVFHNFYSVYQGGVHNLDTVAKLSNVTLTSVNTDADYPNFEDTTSGNFSISVASPLATYATDGGAIGDPRWAPEVNLYSDRVHLIPNVGTDTLRKFIHDTASYAAGDTIMLVDAGPYVVDGTIDLYKTLTVMGDPSLSVKPLIHCVDQGFRSYRDSTSFYLRGVRMDGSPDGSSGNFVMRFQESATDSSWNTTVIENVEAYGFNGGVQASANTFRAKHDTIIINNCLWYDFKATGNRQILDTRNAALRYASITNSTFYEIQAGFFGPTWFASATRDTIPQRVVIDHNTIFRVGGSNQSLLQLNENPRDGSLDLTFSNNIVSELHNPANVRPFRIDSTAGNILITHSVFNNFLATDLSKDQFNLDSVVMLSNVDTSNIYLDYPSFTDTTTIPYNLSFPIESYLLTAGTDGGAIGDPRWVPEVGVTIRQPTELVVVDFDFQMEADVVFAEGTDLSVTWSIVNDIEGSGGAATIDPATGLLSPTAEGLVRVKAVSNFSGAYRDSLVVEITPRTFVSSITVGGFIGENPANSINTEGGQLELRATVFPVNADIRGVTWSMDPELATLDSTGITTAIITGTTSGTMTVTATAVDGSGVMGTFEVTLTGQNPITVITITAPSNTVNAGETLQLGVTIEPADADEETINWSIFGAGDGTIASVNSEGLVTGIAEGTVTVRAVTAQTFEVDTILISVVEALGLNLVNNLAEVYPNPVVGNLVNINSALDTEVKVVSLSGQIVLSQQVLKGERTLDLKSLTSGVYIMNVRSGNDLQTIKLVIE